MINEGSSAIQRKKDELIALEKHNMPVSEEEIKLASNKGLIQTVPVECSSSTDEIEFFEWRDDFYAVILGGIKSNQFKGYAFVIPKELWLSDNPDKKVLPKYNWCAFDSGSVKHGTYAFSVKATMIGNNGKKTLCALSTLVVKLYTGISSIKQSFYCFNSKFDFRYENITSTNIAKFMDNNGNIGISEKDGNFRVSMNKFGRKYIATTKTCIKAQQLYNGELLKLKQEYPSDMSCFGWVFEDGQLQQLFPDNYYKNGVLLDEYLQVFKKYAHLFIPINNKETLAQIRNQGENWLGDEAKWLALNNGIASKMAIRFNIG